MGHTFSEMVAFARDLALKSCCHKRVLGSSWERLETEIQPTFTATTAEKPLALIPNSQPDGDSDDDDGT